MTMLILGIFAGMVIKNTPEWQAKKEERDWNTWDIYEEMREEMGVPSSGTAPLVKKWHKKVNPRRKHRA